MLYRVLILLAFPLFALAGDPLPPEFQAALQTFRTEGPKGWAFTQSTASEKQSLVERYDPTKPDMSKWALVQKDGRPPNEDELKDYREKQTRRTRGETAPDVTQQLDLETAERVSEDEERVAFRFRLKAGGKDDTSAPYMRSTFTFHKPTRTIERVELGSMEPFSPMLFVKVQEAKTTMVYSLPSGDRPSLLEKITVKVRGRAMFFKSLDEDLIVSYSDYQYVSKVPAAR